MSLENELSRCFEKRHLRFVTGWRHPIAKGTAFVSHNHSSYELVYHFKGSGMSRLADGKVFDFKEGCVVIYPPGLVHCDSPIPPAEDVCVHFSLPGPIPKVLRQVIHIQPPLDAVLQEDILCLARRAPNLSEVDQLAMDHRVTALIIQLLRLEESRSFGADGSFRQSLVERAKSYIQAHFAQIKGMKDVARHVGVSHHYLRHLFTPACGMNMVEWLSKVRIERAKDLLVHSSLPLKTIATMCGYRNSCYFSRIFLRHEGITPGAFRRRDAISKG